MKIIISMLLLACSVPAFAARVVNVYEEKTFRSNANIVVYVEPTFKSNADVVVYGTRNPVLAAAACY